MPALDGHGIRSLHVVILCHDYMMNDEKSRAQVQLFLQELKASGRWVFKTLEKYPVGYPSEIL